MATQAELLIVDKRHSESPTSEPKTQNEFLAMIQTAVQRGSDLAMVEKLMDLKDRHEKNEARKAFVEAMSAFKANAIRVARDKINPQYNSKYVSLGNLVGTVTPFLSQNGLSVRWDIDQTNSAVKVTCIVTHSMGHSEQVSMTCPPDKSGQKNPIQEIKSAITYGKACTFESICGLASTDANFDDDGNGGGGMNEEAAKDYLSAIQDSSTREELQKNFQEAYAKASAAKDKNAQKTFIDAKTKRYKELSR
jgi:hypothetical protein